MAVRQTESCWKKFANIRFIVTVEPVLLLYISALTMYNPLLQQYMYDNVSKYFNFTAADSQDICGKTGQRNFTNSSLPNFSSMTYMPSKSNQKRDVYELENKVQTETSHWILYFNMANTIPAVFTSSMYGPWSDKVGRKPVLIIALAGEVLNTLSAISIITFGLPYYLLFIGSFVNGLCGSYGSIIMAVLSYTADNTNKSNRALRIGIVESMIYLGAMVGFLISGVWKESSGGYAQPFWGVLGLMATNLVYVALILPQSKREAIVELKKSKPITCDNFKNVLMLFKEHKLLWCGLAAFFLTLFAWSVSDIMVLYVKASPLCWKSTTIGYFMALQTVVVAVFTVGALKFLKSYASDAMLVAIGIVSTIVGNVIRAIADTTALMFWSVTPMFLAGLPNPCLRSILSKLVPSTKQGALFTAVAIVETLSKLISPALFNTLYPITRSELHFPGFCFALTAGFAFVALFFLIPFFYAHAQYKHVASEVESEYEPLPPDPNVEPSEDYRNPPC